MSTEAKRIEIYNVVKWTHNQQDIVDLFNFTKEEVDLIYNNINELLN